jgi:protein-tyrosine-phosphatase
MAEGLLRHLGRGQVDVQSAGLHPGPIHPLALDALAAQGIDITAQRSKHLDDLLSQPFDYVITVCDQMREQCPSFGSSAGTPPVSIHWSIADPIAAAERAPDEAARRKIFAATAAELATRIHYFLAAAAIAPASAPPP